MTRTAFSSTTLRLLPIPFVHLSAAAVLLGTAAVSVRADTSSTPANDSGRSAFDYAEILTVPFPDPEPDQLLDEASEKKAEAVAWFISGQILEQQAELDAALESYRKSLDLDPANYPLAEKVAIEYVRRDEYAESMAVLKDCAAAAPKDARPLVTIAYLYSRYLEKPDLAQKYADAALDINPEDISIYQRLYEVYEAQGNRKAAEAVTEEALQARSKNADYWLELGIWLSDLKIPINSIDPNTKAVKSLTAVFEKAIELAPKDPVALTAAGDFFARIGELERSTELFEAALEQNANLMPAREKLAQAYLRLEKIDSAIAQLKQIIRLDPLRQGAYGLLGQLYEQQGDMSQAALAYEQSLLLNPNQEDAYGRLAEIYLEPASESASEPLDADKATSILKSGTRRFPRSIKMHIMLGIAYLTNSQYQEGLSAFEQANTLFDQEPGAAQTPQFYFQYGIAAERSKEYDQASDLFQKAIEIDPSFHEALNYLGYMWIDRNEKLDEAGELIRKALSIEPDNPAYLDSLGWYYYRKGDFKTALEYLKKAYKEDGTDDPEICDHVGDAYQQLGETGKAIEFWEKALAHEKAADRVDVAAIKDKLEAAKRTMTQLEAAE